MIKGIIMAGGSGTRLHPLTKGCNKHLLSIYDKPLIFYSLSILMLANIKNILIITNSSEIKNFKKLLGNGKRLGIKISYKAQHKPRGISDAFILGRKFIKKDNIALILGDNFFYGQSLTAKLEKNFVNQVGCKIFLKTVSKPENFGVAKIMKNKIVKIIEKPKKKISNYAITGLYFFDNKALKYAQNLKPSKRGELEITDIIENYRKIDQLNYEIIGRGAIWSDAGTIEDLSKISQFVEVTQKVQDILISSPEEISLNKKWISKRTFYKNLEYYGHSLYSEYLKKL